MERAMQQLVSSTKRVKAGTSKAAAAARRSAFVSAYLANRHNATAAAISAGFSAKTARSAGARLLADVNVSRQIAGAAEKAGEIASLSVERTLREVARIGTFDPATVYREDGTIKPIHEMDEGTRAAISSIETETRANGVVVTKV